jgi:hypothetical protein
MKPDISFIIDLAGVQADIIREILRTPAYNVPG